MLHKAHFEPSKFASLNHVVYKTVFLVAITTCRKYSDIQALKLGDGAATVTNKDYQNKTE